MILARVSDVTVCTNDNSRSSGSCRYVISIGALHTWRPLMSLFTMAMIAGLLMLVGIGILVVLVVTESGDS